MKHQKTGPPLKRVKPSPTASQDSSLLGCFSQLTELDDDLRRAAALRLVELVSVPGATSELDYSLKRLTRGLASSRPMARQGFALGLACVLRAVPHVSLTQVLDMIEQATVTSAKDKGDEERAKLLGRGLGYLSLVDSHKLSPGECERVVEGLCQLASKKSWMREFASGGLVYAVSRLDAPTPRLVAKLAPFVPLNAETYSADGPLDAEQLAVALCVQRKWASRTAVRGDAAALAEPLAAAWRADPPRLCLVWEQVIDAALEAGVLEPVWAGVVEPALLRGGIVSPARKAAAMLALSYALTRPGVQAHVGALLSKDMVHALLSHAVSKDKSLFAPANAALERLAAALEGDDEALVPVRAEVMARLRACPQQGKASRAAIARLLAGLKGAALDEHLDTLKNLGEDEPWAVAALHECCRVHPSATMQCARFYVDAKAWTALGGLLGLAVAQGDALEVMTSVCEWAGVKEPKALRRLRKKQAEGAVEARALQLLVCFVNVLMLLGSEDKAQLELLSEDLLVAAEKLAGKPQEGEETVDPVAVVADAMLALLATQDSKLVRDVVGQAAKQLAPRMAKSAAAVGILGAALQRGLEGEGNEQEEEEENGTNEFAADDDGGDDSADEDDAGSGDNNDDASSADAYDRALASYVKLRVESTSKSLKKQKRKAVREAIVFKLRVLDLVECVAKAQALPELVWPLLTACEQCTRKGVDPIGNELVGRASGVLRRLLKGPPPADLAANALGLCRRAKSKPVARMALEAAGYASEDGSEGLEALLSDLVKGRGLALDAKTVGTVLLARPGLARACLPALLRFEPRTPFQRGEALALTTRLFKALKTDAEGVLGSAMRAVQREEDDGGKGSSQRLRDALKLALQAKAEGACFGPEFRASLERMARQSSSPALKQLAVQCLS